MKTIQQSLTLRKLILSIFHFNLMQHSWGRTYIGGKFYYVLSENHIPAFWTDKEPDEEHTFCLQKDVHPEWDPAESTTKPVFKRFVSQVRGAIANPGHFLSEASIITGFVIFGLTMLICIFSLAYTITNFLNAIQ